MRLPTANGSTFGSRRRARRDRRSGRAAAAPPASRAPDTTLPAVDPAGFQRPLPCGELTPSVFRATACVALRERPDGPRLTALLIHPGVPTRPRHNSAARQLQLATWAAEQPCGSAR
ncbi:hypothetical protein ACIQOU_14670 [Streptomyces sp. NPDC091279]|uniref:hypothetical protein n=1 Tax=Streptomyces sp. NPDC091279 TaxID=3365983 RepID=UPI003803BCCD